MKGGRFHLQTSQNMNMWSGAKDAMFVSVRFSHRQNWFLKIQLAIVQKMYVDMFGCECGWVRVSVYPNYNVCHILSSLGRGKIVTDFSMGVQYIK